MTKESSNTKDLIVEKASKLFAMSGFQGTSIRDIAQACDVNIASINYHFGSKQGLYLEVSNRSYDWLEKGLEKICEKSDDLENFVIQSFEHMITKPDVVCTSIRLILTDGIGDSEHEEFCHKGTQGPPGSEFFLKMIKKEFEEDLPQDTLEFLVKSFFSQVLHFAMIYSSPRYSEVAKKDKKMSKEGINNHLRHHVRALMSYVKSNKNLELGKKN